MTYHTIEDIETANRTLGHHWFDPSTRRFFNSRSSGPVIGGQYFVSSERQSMAYPRLFTIRRADPSGAIHTVGVFQEFASKRDALSYARELAGEE